MSSTISKLVDRHGDVQVLPTTFAQQRFWLLDQIGDAGGSFTIPMALRLRGNLDISALEGALNLIVERHESLRTVFAVDGEEPVQVVLPSLHIPLAVDDVRERPASEREQLVQDRATINANSTFVLASAPLFRASLLRVDENEYVLFMAMHHIVGDGWSVGVLFAELERAYAALRMGQQPALEALPLQYPDFAVWQRQALQGGAAARQIAYWSERLKDAPTLELPADRGRPAVQTTNGGKRERIIDRPSVEGMRALSRAEGATAYMTFLAAFFALLHRYTSQTDIVVGSITSGRSRPEVEPLIGLFINTLAIRADVDGDPTFVDFLRRIVAVTTGAYANQDVPFEQVIDAVQPMRDRSRSPIFQVAFQLLEGLGRDLRLPGIAIRRVVGAKDTTKFDLTLMLHAAPHGELRAVMEYNSDLFDVESVDRMLAHFSMLVAGIVRDPRCTLSQLPLLAPDEQQELLRASRGSRSSWQAACVHTMIEEQADATPNAIAVSGTDGVLTYAELDARANQLAAHLQALGVESGHSVGVCLPRDGGLVVALLAALKTGAHYVPLDPEYPVDRLAFILEDSGASVLIASSETRERLPHSKARIVMIDTERVIIGAHSRARSAVKVTNEQLAYVLHTSGSTGKPKGVMIPHRAVSNLLRSMSERPGLTSSDAVVAVTTLSFDIAGLELWLPLSVGARVVVAPRSVVLDGRALAQLVTETADAVGVAGGSVLLQATPATWRMLIDGGWSGTDGLCMLCGGEAWGADLAAALLSRGASLWNVYGPTETTIWSSIAHVQRPETITLGTPILNTSLVVLDARGALVPCGVTGELYIGGDGVAHGYLNRPELTAEKFVPDPFAVPPDMRMYRTGDLVRRRNDGTLEYLRRIDQQVKLRGFRIELGEVESVLAAIPSVSQAVVVIHSPGIAAQLIAYVIPAEQSATLDSSLLREALLRSLPEYMVPQQFVMATAFPLTPNGKIDRRALSVSAVELPPAEAFVAPRTLMETLVAETWQRVLGCERVGANDRFFALGGNSMAATRVAVHLSEQLGITVPVRVLFEESTPAALGIWLEAHAQGTDDNDIAAILAELGELSDEEAQALLMQDQPNVS